QKTKDRNTKKQQTTLSEMIKSNTSHKGNRRKEIIKGVIKWILLDNQPLSAPRKKGFRCMMEIIDPKFCPPSNKLIKNKIMLYYLRNVNLLRQEIASSCETAAITADLWTSCNNQDSIGVTCHWVTPNWSLYSVLLCCEKLPYPHTAESIHQFLLNKCTEFNLE
ncbi:4239_t:CDS:1, partial [Cetraspora pellucida]